MKRDGGLQSLWQHENEFAETSSFDQAKEYDVLIVGGGITGLTTALLLQEAGKSCVIAEKDTIGFGTTLGTSAHINNFFDTTFKQVIKNFGMEEAKLLYKGGITAVAHIQNNIQRYNIDCGYSRADGYIFSLNEDQNKILDEIVEGGKKVGLPIDYTNQNPFPIPYLKIALVGGQAQFDPAPYISALAKAFEKAGGVIIQNCTVLSIKEDEMIEAATSRYPIKAKNIIYATHIPPGVNLLHFRCAPYRSYVVAATLSSGYYPDLGYDLNDPYHYYRTQEVKGTRYLIAGGEDHKTGHEENTEACFRRLESHLRSYFDVKEIVFHWSSQYFEPSDGLPYIGNLPGSNSNVYVATGFGGNGITYGTLSGIILSDILLKGDTEYRKLFDPNRLKPVAGFTNFVKEGADVVKTFVSGKLQSEKIEELAALAPGEGKIVKYEGNKIALYKDQSHNIYAVDPSCPHVHCNVAWNSAEKTWDCPCHGSRFSVTGELLTGPAQKGLQKIDIEEEE